jgi:hypothetical protein
VEFASVALASDERILPVAASTIKIELAALVQIARRR